MSRLSSGSFECCDSSRKRQRKDQKHRENEMVTGKSPDKTVMTEGGRQRRQRETEVQEGKGGGVCQEDNSKQASVGVGLSPYAQAPSQRDTCNHASEATEVGQSLHVRSQHQGGRRERMHETGARQPLRGGTAASGLTACAQ